MTLPTQEQFAEWDSEYFDGEGQNFDVMMIKAFQAGADKRLEQVIEWLGFELYRYTDASFDGITEIDYGNLFDDLEKAMRPQQQENN